MAAVAPSAMHCRHFSSLPAVTKQELPASRQRRIAAVPTPPLPLEEIGAVDRRGAYADAEVGRAERGGGRLAHLEHRLVARLPDHDRAHAGRLTTVQRSESMRRRLDLPRGATYPSGQRMSVFVLLVAVVLAVVLWRLAARLRDLDRQVRELRLLHREIEELRADLDRGLGVTRAP